MAVGGGSTIDTAKAVNLLLTNPGELMDYVNAPVGRGRPPSRPLKPLVAVPTTTGTGAESTTICVLDVLAQKVKSGISHARLRPTLAVVDPALTMTQPAGVTASSGMDILCHALESYTARWYATNEQKRPEQRVPYCGANPISDMWSEQAMRLLAGAFRTAVRHGDDEQARADMALAATFAAWASATPECTSRTPTPTRSRAGSRLPPRGLSGPRAVGAPRHVGRATAPEAFRFTFGASPERHLRAAELLAPGRDGRRPGGALPAVLIDLMRDIGIPNGIAAVGFGEADIADLVVGTMKQQRLLATAPRALTEDDAAAIFRRSLQLW